MAVALKEALKLVFGRKEHLPPEEPEPLIFVSRKGLLYLPSREVDRRTEALKADPETAEVMGQVENGPNAALYFKLDSKIRATRIGREEIEREEKEYLRIAARALFFGNTVTDAHIEGMIKKGGPVNWISSISWDPIEDLGGGLLFDPESLLLEERVAEIQKGEFALPQNEADLRRNAELQVTRIEQQLLSGVLEGKARAIGVNPKIGKWVGETMIGALKELQNSFIPGLG